MYNIILIGAGELGSRHLQGLIKAKATLNIKSQWEEWGSQRKFQGLLVFY